MDHYIHPIQCPRQARQVAHVAYEIPQAGMVVPADPHFMLLELVPAVYNNLGRMIFLEHDLDKLLPKRTRSPSHQDNFFIPIHFGSMVKRMIGRFSKWRAVSINPAFLKAAASPGYTHG